MKKSYSNGICHGQYKSNEKKCRLNARAWCFGSKESKSFNQNSLVPGQWIEVYKIRGDGVGIKCDNRSNNEDLVGDRKSVAEARARENGERLKSEWDWNSWHEPHCRSDAMQRLLLWEYTSI